jgi:hypothetical protein
LVQHRIDRQTSIKAIATHHAVRSHRLPPQRLRRTIPFVPSHCDRWHEPLPAHPGPDGPERTWHQVTDLPALATQVTGYQGHYRTCPGCGTLNHVPIPAEIKAHGTGPRLAALLAYLARRRPPRRPVPGASDSLAPLFI